MMIPFHSRLFSFLWLLFSFRVFAEQATVTINADGEIHQEETIASQSSSYGVDASWPMQHHHASGMANSNNVDSPVLWNHQRDEYDRYVLGCLGQGQKRTSNVIASCHKYEEDRIDMNLNQPKMMENYTHAGFAKVQSPPSIHKLLKAFWENNNHGKNSKEEHWDVFNTYVNHWESPTKMLDILDDSNDVENPLSHQQRWQLVKEIQSVLEAWTKQPLVLTSLYGIRVYHHGSILAPHVDRLPLVSSAILNIAQDLDEPWPLEVIGHDGIAHNLTMEPGQMVLYESHSVIHGRPFPLRGRFYANLFVHFEPLGHTLRHTNRMDETLPDSAKLAYEKAFQMEQHFKDFDEFKVTSTQNSIDDLPHYVDPKNEVRWNQHFDYEMDVKVSLKPLRQVMISITPHNAAASGNLDALQSLAESDRSNLFKRDQNGWRPLHEAARAGHTEVLEYLLKEGGQVNERTNNGQGGNPLWWAEKEEERNKETIALLKKYGAVSLQPKILDNEKRNDQKKEKEHLKKESRKDS